MRSVRSDLACLAVGATLIVAATFLHPPAVVSTAAGVVGFLLILTGSYLSLRGVRSPGPPDGGGGFWGGGGPPSSGHGNHGGFGGGHGGGHG